MESLKLNLIILMKLNRLNGCTILFSFCVAARRIRKWRNYVRAHEAVASELFELRNGKFKIKFIIILMKLNRLKIEREKGKKEVLRLSRRLSHSITDAIIPALKHRIPSELRS